MGDLPTPPYTEATVPGGVVDRARDAYERTECATGCCGDVDAAIRIAFAAGRAQAAADIRAVAVAGPAGAPREVPSLIAETAAVCALIAERGAEAVATDGEVEALARGMLRRSTERD